MNADEPDCHPILTRLIESAATPLVSKVFGVAAFLSSPVLPCLFYMETEGGTLEYGMIAQIVAAAIASFLIFALSHDSSLNAPKRFVAGGCFSYVAFAVLLILASAITGVAAEMFMWWPIIALFGVPFMAPMILLNWLAAEAIFGTVPISKLVSDTPSVPNE